MKTAVCHISLLLLASQLQAATIPPLRVLGCDCLLPPILITNAQHEPVGGLVYDLTERIARDLSTTLQWKMTSPQRTDTMLASGEIDLICYYSPQWSRLPKGELQWSGDIYRQHDRLLGHIGTAQLEELSELRGKRVGLIQSYSYPGLHELLRDGQIRERRSRNHITNFHLLEQHRIDYVVSPEPFIADYLKRTPQARERLQIAPQVIDTTSVQCAVPRAGRADSKRLLASIEKLRNSGEFERIAQRYQTH